MGAMNSLQRCYLFCTTLTTLAIIIALSHLLFSPASSNCLSIQQQQQRRLISDSPRGLEMEEKTRLGSKPPSCHNKCNECHPCVAVQVPTLPGQSLHLVQPDSYSNYKPLGWRCRCRDHFFNP